VAARRFPLRGFRGIIYKEVLQILRDPVALFFAFFPPLMQVIAFGFAIDTDVKHTPAVVLNLDRRQASREFLDSLRNTEYIDIVRETGSKEEMNRALLSGNAHVGIEIPPDYSERLLRGEGATVLVLVDGSNNTIASQALNVTSAVALRKSLETLMRETGRDSLALDTRPKVLYNPDLRSENFFVPGVVAIALQLVTTFLTAMSIVRERERGTLEQLIVTPLSKFGLLLGKIVPYVVIAVAEVCFLFLVMVTVFRVPIAGSLSLLLALSTVFIFTNLSIGLLISARAATQTQAVQMSMVMLMPSIFLSGFIFPRFTMPALFYWLGFALPTTYYMNIIRGVIVRGAGAGELAADITALGVFGLVLFMLAVKGFRKQIR